MPYNDPRLLASGSKTAQSPLTIALSDAGILPAAHLINGLIVISVISAGNSSLYVASRTLLYLGRTGKAPKLLGRTNKAGVPWVALLASNLFACIAFLSLSSSAGKVYSALITLSGGKSWFQSRYHLTKSPAYLADKTLTANSGDVLSVDSHLYHPHPLSKSLGCSGPRCFHTPL